VELDLDEQIDSLATLIAASSHCIFATGAGISTNRCEDSSRFVAAYSQPSWLGIAHLGVSDVV
jgi:hypothetical protein